MRRTTVIERMYHAGIDSIDWVIVLAIKPSNLREVLLVSPWSAVLGLLLGSGAGSGNTMQVVVVGEALNHLGNCEDHS